METPKDFAKGMASSKEAEQGGAEQAVRPHIPSQKLIFKEFRNLIDFCSLLNKDYFIPSSLWFEHSAPYSSAVIIKVIIV